MKLLASALSIATLASSVAAHATWQNLWINGVDYSGSCLRKPNNNSPVSVGTNELNCNFAAAQAPNTCALKAGDTVRVEMHEQPGDRSCAKEAISGKHYGPVMIYLGKVGDARTADPNTVGWFKIAESGLVSNNPDYFGNQVLNNNCGLFQFKIPADIANGDYLLRAETIGLHVAGSAGGAQFYMSCFQLQISGGGTATPPTVRFPAAYGSSDPGILVDIYRDLTTYVIPGPTPYGTTRAAVATTAWPTAATLPTSNIPATSFTTLPPGAAQPTTTSGTATTTAAPPLQTLYGQCGGQDWTGPTVCQSPYKCTVLSQYYSQCTP